ncbi:hypothetical protein Y032_0050g2035 [Ancylostoma ceylanicum]|uniref:Uncharacterized protein n=1 Tax=Ancylostoma ceylanicum TaxID=53326 RepID=A0A016U8N4_9BILA|nr:hypothetical protein Y032_0050g2035 [Ancylostoma ceylanicum]
MLSSRSNATPRQITVGSTTGQVRRRCVYRTCAVMATTVFKSSKEMRTRRRERRENRDNLIPFVVLWLACLTCATLPLKAASTEIFVPEILIVLEPHRVSQQFYDGSTTENWTVSEIQVV